MGFALIDYNSTINSNQYYLIKFNEKGLKRTVNHRDAGSSPAWGAIIESPFRESLKGGFFVLRLVPFTFPILVKQTD